mgnify:CR=1 FL=1
MNDFIIGGQAGWLLAEHEQLPRSAAPSAPPLGHRRRCARVKVHLLGRRAAHPCCRRGGHRDGGAAIQVDGDPQPRVAGGLQLRRPARADGAGHARAQQD